MTTARNLAAFGTVSNQQQDNRNLLYNGAMQVAQRGTSVAGITGGNYYTADRWPTYLASAGTWTNSVEADAPAGTGLSKSLKWLCTTAQSSLSAGAAQIPSQIIEGQDLQRLAYGSAGAQQVTLSFWVKSNVTGTYIAELDAARQVSAAYSISASGTWERKSVTFPANTVNVIANDNTAGISVRMWLAAGSTFSGGSSLQTAWGSTQANRAVGQVNTAAAVNNYWQVTGVQLEAGPAATPFEFKSYGQELRECQRYFASSYPTGTAVGSNTGGQPCLSTAVSNGVYGSVSRFSLPTPMRTPPTVTLYSSTGTIGQFAWDQFVVSNEVVASTTEQVSILGFTVTSSSLTATRNRAWGHWAATAEL